MSSYKDLILKLEDIHPAIKDFSEEGSFSVSTPRQGEELIVYQLPGQVAATLNVYYKTGTVSLYAGSGKNKDLSNSLAQHIISKCSLNSVSSLPLRIKGFSLDHFNQMLEYLRSEKHEVLDGNRIEHGKQYKIIGDNGQIAINYFNTGSLVITGKASKLKYDVIAILSELLPYKQVIDMQLETLSTNVKSEEIIDEFENRNPISYPLLGETLVSVIAPSVAISKVDILLTDYSLFVFPAFRGLEGVIKKLFLEYSGGVPMNARDSISYYFEFSENGAKLVEEYSSLFKEKKVVTAINNMMNFFNKHRNGLFHVDSLIDTTKIIENKNEAIEIIDDILTLIEREYTSITTK